MQTITVDMTPGFRQPTIHYSQNDVGTTFAIDLRSRFGDTLPASPTVKIQATKPSGFGFSIEADSVVDSVATFTTVDTMTDEAGRFQAELQIIKDAVVIYTANFYMEGEANPHPIGTTDGSQETVIPTLTLLVERVEAAASSVLDMTVNATTLAAGSQATYSYDEATNTATFGIPQGEAGAGAAGVTASAYSASRTYAVGDYVIHNNNLYRCTTAITTAESFTAAHWTQVVLGDDVTDLKSDLKYENISKSALIPYTEKFLKTYTSDVGVFVIQTSPTSIQYNCIYAVKKDCTYNIKGQGRVGVNGYSLIAFNDSIPDTTGTTLKEVIETGTTTISDYNVNYTAKKDGYLFVQRGESWGCLCVFEVSKYKSKILDEVINSLYSTNVPIGSSVSSGVYYNSSTDAFGTGGDALKAFYIPVEADKTYRIVGKNAKTLAANYSLIAFSTSAPAYEVSGACLLDGSTTEINFDYIFTANENGYISAMKHNNHNNEYAFYEVTSVDKVVEIESYFVEEGTQAN